MKKKPPRSAVLKPGDLLLSRLPGSTSWQLRILVSQKTPQTVATFPSWEAAFSYAVEEFATCTTGTERDGDVIPGTIRRTFRVVGVDYVRVR